MQTVLNDDGDDSTVQASAFKAEETGECSGDLGKMGEGESAWQVGDDIWPLRQWSVYSYDALSRLHDQSQIMKF